MGGKFEIVQDFVISCTTSAIRLSAKVSVLDGYLAKGCFINMAPPNNSALHPMQLSTHPTYFPKLAKNAHTILLERIRTLAIRKITCDSSGAGCSVCMHANQYSISLFLYFFFLIN